MKMHRILAITRRHFILTYRGTERIINVLYQPFFNIVLWGLTSMWMQQQSKNPIIIRTILIALTLWQVVFRIYIETAKGNHGRIAQPQRS